MQGQHVVVTGASSGIGEATAKLFSERGARVTLVARRRANLDRIAAGLGGQKQVIEADLSDPERATSWLSAAESGLGPIDVLINNAGSHLIGNTAELDPDAGEGLLALDLATPMRLTIAVLPKMLARHAGTIVNMSSIVTYAPTPRMYYYNAAKSGIAAASEGLRGELYGTGVNVVTVYPGPILTAMESFAHDRIQRSFFIDHVPRGTPEGLARCIHTAVRKRRARVVYPRFYHLITLTPRLSAWMTFKLTPPLKPQAALPATAREKEHVS